MQATAIQDKNVDYLDSIFMGQDKLLRPVPYAVLQDVPQVDIVIWCNKNGVYQIATIELIEWLREQIAGRKAIEIGAGKSGIGRALGIPTTDSFLHTQPLIQIYYSMLKQTITIPPDYVEELDAEQAIKKYEPEVVVGAFITQKHHEGEDGGNMWGVEDGEVVKAATYIHIGHDTPHGKKRINALPHKKYRFPWLVNRCFFREMSAISVWEKQSG